MESKAIEGIWKTLGLLIAIALVATYRFVFHQDVSVDSLNSIYIDIYLFIYIYIYNI